MSKYCFGTVMQKIKCHVSRGARLNQADIMGLVLKDYLEEYDKTLDPGHASRLYRGIDRPGADVVHYYHINAHQRLLVDTINREILPLMPDSALAAQEVYDTVQGAQNLSMQKKTDILECFCNEDDEERSAFLAETICLALQMPQM